jgi:hypothetical protein
VSGFQSGAFQPSAFQHVSTASANAFQRGAFQSGAFQLPGDSATEAANAGGWRFPTPKVKTAEDVRRERIRLGIIPAPVEKVVEKAARRVIARAKAKAGEQQGADPVEYLRTHQAQQRAILEADLRKRQIEASLSDQRTYMILLAIEVQRQAIQEAEDEQILMLLMDM